MATQAKSAGQAKASNKVVVLLSVLLLGTIILALFTFLHVSQRSSYDEKYLLRSSDERIHSQRIAKFALAAARGDTDAFAMLKKSRDQFARILQELREGSAADSLPPSPQEVKPQLDALDRSWIRLNQGVELVLKNQQEILGVGQFVKVITDLLPQLQRNFEDVVKILLKQKASQHQVFLATNQLMLAQRIEHNASRVLAGGQATDIAIEQFGKDAEQFGKVLEGMLRGDAEMGIQQVANAEVEQKLREVAMLFTTIKQHAEEIIRITPNVLPAVDAANKLTESSDVVNDAAEQLISAFRESPGRISILGIKAGPVLISVLGALSTLLLVLLGWTLVRESRRQAAAIREQNDINQAAILRLLDEMGDLADGNLTVQATVTEDITGAIADSMNYAIEATRSLVTTIKSAAEQVSRSAQDTRATAMQLAEASELQAEEITAASDAIRRMTLAIDQMSNDASESADVAQRSVEIAAKGADTVRRTIQGMDSIREQIQETSKRIKRLGESSQEIGDIVELIDDIADQTNILALNAAMQAAMAGEAGRGFAVVADEVQRLAERSSNATKQIDALVKTIQADTNEAVRSMEASTSGVVSGAKLAEDAGEALKEIENVSNYIADLTRKIADSAQKQSAAATGVNNTMTVIRQITSQTTESTTQTAASIGNLADLANDLQKSVTGFRLPT